MTELLRIGDVAARTGVGVQTLRAWERRYGVLSPARTAGGHRLYSEADIERVNQVVALHRQGLSLAAAADVARIELVPPAVDTALEARVRTELLDAARRLDAEGVHRGLDTAFANLTLAAAVDDVLAPVFHDLGEWWKDDMGGVAAEHVATQVVRGRLTSLLRSHTAPGGPPLLAVCPPGEDHDLGLLMASVLLAERGWAVTFLGASTPGPAIGAAIERVRPVAAVAAAYTRPAARRMMEYRAAAPPQVVLGGPGFRPADVELGGPGFALAATIGDAPDLVTILRSGAAPARSSRQPPRRTARR